jgi:hypothetical protein
MAPNDQDRPEKPKAEGPRWRRHRSDKDEHAGNGGEHLAHRSRRNRRSLVLDTAAAVAVPSSGRNPRARRGRSRRNRPVGGTARRRLTRAQIDDLNTYFQRMPEPLLMALYRGLGGQPGRVAGRDRMLQLTVRAIAQGSRLGALLHTLHERERQALGMLLQAGGLAHADEFHRELFLTLGGHEHEWRTVMQRLGENGLVCASEVRDNQFFYLVPNPLVDHLVEHLGPELALPTFENPEIQILDERPFCPPLDFTITTLATYMDQRPPRLTQRQEVYRVHKEEMDVFFSQIWNPDSDLFNFHIDFLMMHGMIELRGDRVAVSREVVEEWLNLDPDDQRELIFLALEKRFTYAEWVLWAVHGGNGAWIPDKALQAMYRRWSRGEDWRKRFRSDAWTAARTNEREGFSFAPLVNAGMLEMGSWGQERFYRLTQRARTLLDPPEDDGFTKFYLTPSFEVMAPAGLAPILLFRIGELAELVGCDRANTYKITEVTIEQALARGWRRDDVLDFLRDNSQIGLAENVEATLRGWMGQHGDVEFHDVTLLIVQRTGIRRLESQKRLKPYLLHRFAPGMYAVDPRRLPELQSLLEEHSFHPSKDVRYYPGTDEVNEARDHLQKQVIAAREATEDPLARAQAEDTAPEDLHPVPGSGIRDRKKPKSHAALPPRTTAEETQRLLQTALSTGANIEVVYVTRDDRRTLVKLIPERLAITREGEQVLVARDLEKDERLTYRVGQIERIRVLAADTSP